VKDRNVRSTKKGRSGTPLRAAEEIDRNWPMDKALSFAWAFGLAALVLFVALYLPW